jgi:hypothetical protein
MRGITANAVLFLLFDGIMVDGFVIQGKFYGQRLRPPNLPDIIG